MNITIDCEWNSFGGELLSMGLMAEDGRFMYLTCDREGIVIDPWVEENVIPHINKIPESYHARIVAPDVYPSEFSSLLGDYLRLFDSVNIIADWPEDIMWFTKMLITGPGYRIDYPPMTIEVRSDIEGCSKEYPHNAIYDAIELMNQWKAQL